VPGGGFGDALDEGDALTRVAVLDYGMGNLRSVARAVEHGGGEPVVTSDPADALSADALVVPGVGHFAACMTGLRERELDATVKEYAGTGRPLLGVCLGMQVLFEHSEEGDVPGLGVLAGEVIRVPGAVKVPHMGWNQVRWEGDHPLSPDHAADYYFVHSYVCVPSEPIAVGRTEYGTTFVSAVARDNIFATQFHPEKSSSDGLEIYRNLVEAAS
jgi:glutamine amidotransferase